MMIWRVFGTNPLASRSLALSLPLIVFVVMFTGGTINASIRTSELR